MHALYFILGKLRVDVWRHKFTFSSEGKQGWRTRRLPWQEKNLCVCEVREDEFINVKLNPVAYWTLSLELFQNHFWSFEIWMPGYHFWKLWFHRFWEDPGICTFHRELVLEHTSFLKLWLFPRENRPTRLLARVFSSHHSSRGSKAGSSGFHFISWLMQKLKRIVFSFSYAIDRSGFNFSPCWSTLLIENVLIVQI